MEFVSINDFTIDYKSLEGKEFAKKKYSLIGDRGFNIPYPEV